jgi:hypothetical protein
MKLDDAAAAYGLMQVVFADVTDRLACAVFELQRTHDASTDFTDIYRKDFKRIREALKEELKQPGEKKQIAEDLRAVREAQIGRAHV